MSVKTWLVAMGLAAAGLGCSGDDGATGSQGLQGSQGTPGPQGERGPAGPPGQSWQVGTGLALSNNVLNLRFGTGAEFPVSDNDLRLSNPREPLPDSASYIQNKANGDTQTASFRISGPGIVQERLATNTELIVDTSKGIPNTPPSPSDPSNTLLRLQNTLNTGVKWTQFPLLTVDSAGSILARGEAGQGPIPMTGQGVRLMWWPRQGAFRAGYADAQWDSASVGLYSWAGGNQTLASGQGAFAMGERCTAGGRNSVCMGNNSSATSDSSVALGYRVSTGNFPGSFVFGDQSSLDIHTVSAPNQFLVRASGGIRLRTSSNLNLGCDVPSDTSELRCTSDRNEKDDFRNVDGEALLGKVANLPISTWRYKREQADVRHMGPVAQDFRATFGLGTDNKSIGLLDISGVNLAAIQALEVRTRELREKSAEVDALKSEMAELKRTMSRLEAAVLAKDARP
ncbi:tail fiber domain-containing protein [Myxococcus landrumensis]|uniref:Tail fiber domain-containing protein n=1 Tax=Myxococcus landrumensis TaxID=2813577 RepID=A0ABX7NEP3_9BACT|nr:tail fiber domain-containing protein [Myxococcus landrumus]QSQ17297.1 tail fiber domain-containing protein [Myxococcus landrumus]